MPPLNFLNISVFVLYFDWYDNFSFCQKPSYVTWICFCFNPWYGIWCCFQLSTTNNYESHAIGGVWFFSSCRQFLFGILENLEKVFVWDPQDGLWWLLLCLLLSVPFAAVPAPDFAIDELLFGCLVWLLVRYIMMIDFGLTKTNIRGLHSFSSLTILYYWVLVGNIVLKKTVGRVVDNTVQ